MEEIVYYQDLLKTEMLSNSQIAKIEELAEYTQQIIKENHIFVQ